MARRQFFDPDDPRPQWRQFVDSWRSKVILALNAGFFVYWLSLANRSPKVTRCPFLGVGCGVLLLGAFLSTAWPPTRRLSPDNRIFFRVIMLVTLLVPGTSLIVAAAVALLRAAR